MVAEVKADKEVGVAYVKSFERDQRARMEGKAEGKAESLLLLLGDLGEVPKSLRERVLSETDEDILNGWLRASRRAENLRQYVEMAGIFPEGMESS